LAKVFQMRKPAEMMKLMTALIIIGCLEDNRLNLENGTLRETHTLDNCSLFAVKKGQLNKMCNVSHISLPQLGRIQPG